MLSDVNETEYSTLRGKRMVLEADFNEAAEGRIAKLVWGTCDSSNCIA